MGHFGQSNMDRTPHFCPDQPARNQMYQSESENKILLFNLYTVTLTKKLWHAINLNKEATTELLTFPLKAANIKKLFGKWQQTSGAWFDLKFVAATKLTALGTIQVLRHHDFDLFWPTHTPYRQTSAFPIPTLNMTSSFLIPTHLFNK